MSESSRAVTSGAVILEECPEGSREREQAQGQEPGPLRCGGCTVWPRQQTWLCVVPLLIGFIGLGLSLMLLKWIVVGSVRDYVPTDLVDAKGIGQDPMFPPHLSKPSTFPKNSDTTTTTKANPTSTTVTAVRGRTRTVVAHHPSGTTTTAKVGGVSGSQVTPRSTTQRQGNSGGGGPQGPVITTTTAAPVAIFTTSSTSPFNPTVLHDSTEMWTHKHSMERPATTPTRTHVNRKTSSPTIPQMRSEHFKQCHVKDLAYCLNDGECFVIETLSGPHKHCRCKEGYQGIRCDQFLPKTDSILSDPNHLGIEFMESKEVYKRQVLSITCITVGISVLGILCMALYCRNKRRREKLQAHLKESCSLKNYSGNASALELSKSSLRPDMGLQLQNYCKRSSQPHEGAVCKSSFSQCNATPTDDSRGPDTGKHYRSSSLSHSPDQISKATHWSVPRKTLPIPRGRRNPIGGSKHSGPAYQHLQELESSEREVELLKGYQIVGAGSDPRQDAFLNMQSPMLIERSWESRVEVRCSLLDQVQDHDISTSTRNLRCPRHPSLSSPPPFQTSSIPIIPSVQGNQDEVSCLQTATTGSATCSATPSMEVGGGCSLITLHHASTSCTSSTGGQQQNEMALIQEEAQENLRALANRKQEESGSFSPSPPRETVCFLTLNGGGVRGVSPNGPIETQLLSPREPHTDSTQPCQ